jgi:hypothetical protein
VVRIHTLCRSCVAASPRLDAVLAHSHVRTKTLGAVGQRLPCPQATWAGLVQCGCPGATAPDVPPVRA